MKIHRFATRGKRKQVRDIMLNDSFQEGQRMWADYRVSLLGLGHSRLEIYDDNRDEVTHRVRCGEAWDQWFIDNPAE